MKQINSLALAQKKEDMTVADYGGEHKLIEAISYPAQLKSVLVGIGDDAALLKLSVNASGSLAVSKDLFIEGRHFTLSTFTARQIGIKAIESSLSDLAAMGSRPLYALVGLGLTKHTTIKWVTELYKGLRAAAMRHGVDVVGGDTVRSDSICLSITVIGNTTGTGTGTGTTKALRRNAKTGDQIWVSGSLGKAAAGLHALSQQIKGFASLKKSQREPVARFDVLPQILPYVHAMIDLSDGLAGDLGHVCAQSGVGATIIWNDLPIDKEMLRFCKHTGKQVRDLVLYGGEDYELLYTVPPSAAQKTNLPGTQIGFITSQKTMVLIETDGSRSTLHPKGFDHFQQ